MAVLTFSVCGPPQSIRFATPPPTPIRLALFDVDGTLLDADGNLSSRLKSQMQRIRRLGVKTAIASGRPCFAADWLLQELALQDAGMFCTGAHVYDPLLKQTLITTFIDPEVNRKLLSLLRTRPVYYELYTEDAYFYETPIAPVIRKDHAKHLRAVPVKEDLLLRAERGGVLKYLLGAPGSEGLDLIRELEAACPELHFAYAQFPPHPDWTFASAVSHSVCKRTTFNWLLDHYGVKSDEVVSFGDSHSDMAFLSLAGHGVAMGNAPESVKQVARWVTDPCWEDGVSNALMRLI